MVEEKRVQIFGKDTDGNKKHGFDLVLINGKPYIESIYKGHRKIKTPVDTTISALEKLQQQTG